MAQRHRLPDERGDLRGRGGSDRDVHRSCLSPPATTQTLGNGWTRLTYTVAFARVERISFVFDERQDTGPDFFGLAVLDNVNVNGDRVGSSGGHHDDDDDEEDDD